MFGNVCETKRILVLNCMNERKLYPLLKRQINHTCAVELKICKGTSLPFSSVVPHQVRALSIAKHGVVRYKIPDCGMQNPFDIIILNQVPAYVAICFYKPRKPIEFILIDIDDWIQEEKTSKRRSLIEKRALEIGCG